ncbi:MAG: S46 family peptidase [Melioribacteraceae bacterium]|nr:S46 family peptidase [Melioribacteraceae bacterium]
MKKYFPKRNIILLIAPLLLFISACSSTPQLVEKNEVSFFNPDTVQSTKFDIGKMWTFEDAPVDYFNETYNFKPSEEWLEDVRMSALKFANWCSASFVSGDGLIMTNHHCIEMVSMAIQQEGENIRANGFYAPTLEDERKVPGVFIEQLAFIEDVTSEVVEAIESGKTNEEKLANKAAKIKELREQYSEDTGLICRVTELYNGGKYSLYGYRKYEDVRAVFFAEANIGLYGGDPDNFTYPRYNSDFAFLRVYDEDGKPLQTDHFFKFNLKGVQFDEPIFVVGNPGSTDRLKTVSQLEYMRDIRYPNMDKLLAGAQKIYQELSIEVPSKKDTYEQTMFFISNSAKVYRNLLKGLRDPYLMARKKDFESKFKASVLASPKLKAKYGHIWEGIASANAELKTIGNELNAFRINPRLSPKYVTIAQELVKFAEKLQLPEPERADEYKGEQLQETIDALFPTDFEKLEEDKKLALFAELFELNLGAENLLYKKMFASNKAGEAAKYALNNSKISTKDGLVKLAKAGSEAILSSNDPFIQFILGTKDELAGLEKTAKEIGQTEEVLEDELGKALYAVYGATIPPDATFTLRISDGLLQGYSYNGTVAPAKTTFYGLYDRYYSHNKKAPWDLPEKWIKPSPEFDLSTPYNFVSTCDITGGSSGSPVINKNKEIIGLAFDGNIESLPGSFIFTTEANRMVSVTSEGMVEILADIYGAKRISEELKAGKIVEVECCTTEIEKTPCKEAECKEDKK